MPGDLHRPCRVRAHNRLVAGTLDGLRVLLPLRRCKHSGRCAETAWSRHRWRRDGDSRWLCRGRCNRCGGRGASLGAVACVGVDLHRIGCARRRQGDRGRCRQGGGGANGALVGTRLHGGVLRGRRQRPTARSALIGVPRASRGAVAGGDPGGRRSAVGRCGGAWSGRGGRREGGGNHTTRGTAVQTRPRTRRPVLRGVSCRRRTSCMGEARQFLRRKSRRHRGGVGRLHGLMRSVATGLVASRGGHGVRRRCGCGAETGRDGRAGRGVIALLTLRRSQQPSWRVESCLRIPARVCARGSRRRAHGGTGGWSWPFALMCVRSLL